MTNDIAPQRYLSKDFLDALDALARSPEPNWWRDVLENPTLVIAVRRDCLNVYYWGASIFEIKWTSGRISSRVHVKYLVRNEQNYISLNERNSFEHAGDAVWKHYEGKATLNNMTVAAGAFAGEEKRNLHPMLVRTPDLMDVEISLTREQMEDEEKGQENPGRPGEIDRLDAAVLRTIDGRATIGFCEAKHFSNKDLRATDKPKVLSQIKSYERALEKKTNQLSLGYLNVAKAMVRIDDMRVFNGHSSRLASTIRRLAETDTVPAIDTKPHLLIVGFTDDQKNGRNWDKHHKTLTSELGESRIQMLGNPQKSSSGLLPAYGDKRRR